MKKKAFFIALLTAVAAIAALGVSSASASPMPVLTLAAHPDSASPGGYTTLSGNLSFDGAPVVGAPIYVNEYNNSSCSGESFHLVDTSTTDQNGDYSLYEQVDPSVRPGELWLQATWGPTTEAAASSCVLFTVVASGAVAAAVPQTNGSFLCYTVGGDPKYETDAASAMADLMSGYWLPEAVAGNVPPNLGENFGPYHLDCFNAPQTGGFGNTAAAVSYVDQNGNLLPASYVMGSITDGLGTYPLYGLPATQ